MNYNDAKKLALTQPWVLGTCFSGDDCWCRPIMLVTPINYKYESVNGEIIDDVYDCVVNSAAIDKLTAEYLVNLHNSYLPTKS